MNLKTYLNGLPPADRERFATACETTVGHLRNVMYGLKSCATDLAVLIEHQSDHAVTRQELRNDWARHWPELIGSEGAPPTPTQTADLTEEH